MARGIAAISRGRAGFTAGPAPLRDDARGARARAAGRAAGAADVRRARRAAGAPTPEGRFTDVADAAGALRLDEQRR